MAIAQHAPIILASGSTIRQQMLKAAGLNFSVTPSGVDEDEIKLDLAGRPFTEQALALAKAKTLSVAARHPDAYTIGADQICALGEQMFSKPGSYEAAEAELKLLSGRTHHQHCGMALARGTEVLWTHVGTAALTMRQLTPAEIKAYVAADAPLSSCGAYKFEALGRHLFASIEGDHDVIQGLALVPLLAELHRLNIISLA